MQWLCRWTEHKIFWALLALDTFALLATAMYFQYAQGLEPCVNCIYQRTAVLGIFISACLPLIFNHSLTRLLAYLGWGYSAVHGWLIARHHVQLITDKSFFSMCDFEPSFWFDLPLHDWLPLFFAAPGDCLDDSWRLWGNLMPEWMVISFAVYAALLAVVVINRLVVQKAF